MMFFVNLKTKILLTSVFVRFYIQAEDFWFVISPQGEYVMKTTILSAIEYAESIGKKRKAVWGVSV